MDSYIFTTVVKYNIYILYIFLQYLNEVYGASL